MADGVDIRIRDVVKVYPSARGSLIALDGIDLDVPTQGFVSLLGPSGCGKSTLLHIVAGLTHATSGKVVVDGVNVTQPLTAAGMVFQTDVLLDWRSALGNVLLTADARGRRQPDDIERAKALLDAVGLAGFEDRLPHELSGGMRQRVAICRALFGDPPRLFMDEPFGALDAITRDQLNLDLQRIWLGRRKTVLFVTHSIEEAIFLSDRIVLMTPRPGRVEEVLDIALDRPRTLAIRESSAFVEYKRHIQEVFLARGILADDTPRQSLLHELAS